MLQKKDPNIKIYGLTTGLNSHIGLKKYGYFCYSYEELYGDIRHKKYEKKYLTQRISELENKYGSLWKYAYADRQLVTYHHNDRYGDYDLNHNEIINLIVGFFDYFEDVFGKFSIDTLVYYATASAPFRIAADIIASQGGRFYQISTFRYPDLITLGNDPLCKEIGLNQSPTETDLLWAKAYYVNFLNMPSKPAWDGLRATLFRPLSKVTSTLNLEKLYKNQFKNFDISDPGYLLLSKKARLKRIFNYLNNKISLKLQNSLFRALPADSKYAYFALHLEPEAATMTNAPYHLDQLSLIKNIAKSLPFDMTLCVKEHPTMLNKRNVNYYKELSSIPNVCLLKTNIDGIEIIKRSDLVITITGTVGLEGFLLKKPVITFGETHFNNLKGVYFFNEPLHNMGEFIRTIISKFEPNEVYILEYLAYCHANSISRDSHCMYDDADLNQVAADFMSLFNKISL